MDHGHQNCCEKGGNNAANSRGRLVCREPEKAHSAQCREALGFNFSLASNYQCGQTLVAPWASVF